MKYLSSLLFVLLLAVPTLARAESAMPEPAAEATPQADAKTEELSPRGQLPDDVIYGEEDAPVTIIEYASLTCPHCAHFHQKEFPKLDEKYIKTGKVRLILRPFPLNEPALNAAQLTYCVPQEKYYVFNKVLFELQDKWAFATGHLDSLKKIAAVGGVGEQEFNACIADKQLEEKILKIRQQATDVMKVDATPSFYINGVKMEGSPVMKNFDKALEPLVKK